MGWCKLNYETSFTSNIVLALPHWTPSPHCDVLVTFSSTSLIIFPTNTRYLILFTSCKCLLSKHCSYYTYEFYLCNTLFLVVLGVATMGYLVDLNCLVLTLFPLCLCFVSLNIYFVYVLKYNAPLNNVKLILNGNHGLYTRHCIKVFFFLFLVCGFWIFWNIDCNNWK